MPISGPSPVVRVRNMRPIAWYQFGRGITSSAGLVSRWKDAGTGAHDLIQATGSAQPALQTDGSILFDGTARVMQTVTFTLAQPTMLYMLFRQVTFTNADVICDGFTVTSGQLLQDTTTANISLSAGTTAVTNTTFALNTYSIATAQFNGASSTFSRNKEASPAAANAGTTAMAGFTLGGDGNSLNFANIQVKEVLLFAGQHQQTQQLQVINYLSMIGGLGL